MAGRVLLEALPFSTSAGPGGVGRPGQDLINSVDADEDQSPSARLTSTGRRARVKDVDAEADDALDRRRTEIRPKCSCKARGSRLDAGRSPAKSRCAGPVDVRPPASRSSSELRGRAGLRGALLRPDGTGWSSSAPSWNSGSCHAPKWCRTWSRWYRPTRHSRTSPRLRPLPLRRDCLREGHRFPREDRAGHCCRRPGYSRRHRSDGRLLRVPGEWGCVVGGFMKDVPRPAGQGKGAIVVTAGEPEGLRAAVELQAARHVRGKVVIDLWPRR